MEVPFNMFLTWLRFDRNWLDELSMVYPSCLHLAAGAQLFPHSLVSLSGLTRPGYDAFLPPQLQRPRFFPWKDCDFHLIVCQIRVIEP